MASKKQEFCKNGHARTPENVDGNRRCRICARAYERVWSKADRQKYPEKYKIRDAEREMRTQRSKKRHPMRHYGITLEEYQRRLHEQGYKCAICEEELDDTHGCNGKALDHDHVSGRAREFLCNDCNRGLGCFNDSIFKLEKAEAYLRRWREPNEDHN